MTVDKMIVDKMTVYQIIVDNAIADKMTVHKIDIEKHNVYKLAYKVTFA